MKITFLGTSATFPTKERNHSSLALSYGGEIILFDCGEGTQRQLRIADLSLMKVSKVFLTHWHGDHVLGLAGLLQSFAMNNRKEPVFIYGPKGTKSRLKHLLDAFEVMVGFEIETEELSNSEVKGSGYSVFSSEMEHSVPCLAFAFKEDDRVRLDKNFVSESGISGPVLKKLQEGKDITFDGKKVKAKDVTYLTAGKKITYAVDTALNDNLVKLATNSDILVSEATFMNELKEKAGDRGHMTAKDAGKLAKKAKVKKLYLTHFSQRYKDIKPLIAEAEKYFANIYAAKDFLEVVV